MFGISFGEILLITVVALLVVGPKNLPRLLGAIGSFIGKIRRLSAEMRQQTGIDEILRGEGITGGMSELRTLLDTKTALQGGRSGPRAAPGHQPHEEIPYDRSREYPVEGPDAMGAIPEDLIDDVAQDLPPPGTVPADLGSHPMRRPGEPEPAPARLGGEEGAPDEPQRSPAPPEATPKATA